MPDDDVMKEKRPLDDADTAVSDLAAKKAELAAAAGKKAPTDPADFPAKLDEDVSGPK